MEDFERSAFALSPAELEVQEALVAIQRVLDQDDLAASDRNVLECASRALRLRVG